MAISIFRELKMGKETFLPVSVENNIFKMMWWCEPGGSVPSHIHPHMDEHFTVLEGEVEFTVNGKKLIKKPGDTLFIAKNVAHSIKNIGTTNIKMEVYYTPVADTVEMFKILFFLNQSNPGSASHFVKYFYMFPRLGLKPFSLIPSPFVMRTMNGILSVVGWLAGWNKVIKAYKLIS